jgi:hypothetical protein
MCHRNCSLNNYSSSSSSNNSSTITQQLVSKFNGNPSLKEREIKKLIPQIYKLNKKNEKKV